MFKKALYGIMCAAFGLFMTALVVGGFVASFLVPAHAAGSFDLNAIDASRAGIDHRQSSPRIVVLRTIKDGWREDDRNADRQRCGPNTKAVLKLKLAARIRSLDENDIYGILIDEADVLEYCLATVYRSDNPDRVYPVLLTSVYDYVLNYNGSLIQTWSQIDHKVARFDAFGYDDGAEATGIAPAGEPPAQVEVSRNRPVLSYWPVKSRPEAEMLERLFSQSNQKLPTVPVGGQAVPMPSVKP